MKGIPPSTSTSNLSTTNASNVSCLQPLVNVYLTYSRKWGHAISLNCFLRCTHYMDTQRFRN
ncbi:hypothetical protein DPMN_190028 [Dreissena polymorpha]|uniref:Uncharacterized protein n=1 Tax=Dreissena polymorpha TaxID=45954 RepID=A0A9D4ICR5_DREPO|nr:hypothetical protein DPMN_190028 [Dreissena polymorpha]